MGIRPLEDRVVVRPDSDTDTFDSGGLIVKPVSARERPQQGTVIAVGPGLISDVGEFAGHPVTYFTFERKPLDISIGDKVLYGKYSGVAIPVDGEEVLIMRASDVLAVLGE